MAYQFNPLTGNLDLTGLTEAESDLIYLRLDTTNDPLTGDLAFSADKGISDLDGNTKIYLSSDNILFNTAGTERLVIGSDGHFGFGTTNNSLVFASFSEAYDLDAGSSSAVLGNFQSSVSISTNTSNEYTMLQSLYALSGTGNTTGTQRAIYSTAKSSIAGTVSYLIGLDIAAGNSGINSGTDITNLYGIRVIPETITFGSGTISTFIGLFLSSKTGSATITNHYGIYQEDSTALNLFAGQVQSTVTTGTAPLIIASTTLVSNLNADLLDGKNTGTTGNTIPLLDGLNTWSAVQRLDGGAFLGDNVTLVFGTGSDASIYYDGTDLIFNPAVVGSGIADFSGADLKANFLGLGGSSPSTSAVISASLTSAAVTRAMLFSLTYNGSGATVNPISIAGKYTGSNAAPNVSSNISALLNANPSGNVLFRGVNCSASFSTLQTNAGQKTLIGGYFSTSTILGSHTTGTINTVNLYSAAQTNVGGTATEVTASAWFNGDVVVASTGKLILESSVASEGATGMTFTKGDSYLAFNTTTANKIQIAIDNTVTIDFRAATINLAEAIDFVLGTTTGTKIGTSTSQKLGFFNATPIVQVGATIDLGVVLSDLGLRAAGTAYTITTSGQVTLGSLTAGRVTFAGTAGLLSDDADFTFATDTLTVTKIAATTFTGNITTSAVNLVTDTTTGTKFGTGATQKLGFWNATPVVQSTGWTTSNVTTDKVLDANSTTVDELADVVCTLIEQLKTYGILGA